MSHKAVEWSRSIFNTVQQKVSGNKKKEQETLEDGWHILPSSRKTKSPLDEEIGTTLDLADSSLEREYSGSPTSILEITGRMGHSKPSTWRSQMDGISSSSIGNSSHVYKPNSVGSTPSLSSDHSPPSNPLFYSEKNEKRESESIFITNPKAPWVNNLRRMETPKPNVSTYNESSSATDIPSVSRSAIPFHPISLSLSLDDSPVRKGNVSYGDPNQSPLSYSTKNNTNQSAQSIQNQSMNAFSNQSHISPTNSPSNEKVEPEELEHFHRNTDLALGSNYSDDDLDIQRKLEMLLTDENMANVNEKPNETQVNQSNPPQTSSDSNIEDHHERRIAELSRRMAERKTFPSYWTVSEDNFNSLEDLSSSSSLEYYEEVELNPNAEEFREISKMINSNIGKHGARFGTVNGMDPIAFQVTRVCRIQNQSLWRRYSFHKSDIEAANDFLIKKTAGSLYLQKHPIATKLLDPNANEYYLWHGTSMDKINVVKKQGSDERVGGITGMFGAGIYFAENASKSNQYVPCPICGQGSIISKSAICTCGTSITYTLLLCRVILGDVHIAKTYDEAIYKGTTNAPARRPPVKRQETHELFDSILGESTMHDKNAHLKFREMVVYNRSQVYPEYIVHYKRIAPSSPT
eukprot:TRINITY_DN4368_c0_g1_i1.p1 TRINITY_DN4368_c0_g1~~TRINITY_DN4368_c0_g1_i1.p1  ORF type:complete len:634 (+),score=161.77 TRINITY_DN4368_c0_g1_i1:256-2157(+)